MLVLDTARFSKSVHTTDIDTIYTQFLSISVYTIRCANTFRDTSCKSTVKKEYIFHYTFPPIHYTLPLTHKKKYHTHCA